MTTLKHDTKPTVEELLKPRVKIIAPWPICHHTKPEDIPKVGQIFHVNADNSIFYGSVIIKSVDKYPHLFCELEWYEERTVDQMPGYVKNSRRVVKADQHFKMRSNNAPFEVYDQWSHFIFGDTSSNYIFWKPATIEEYLSYTNARNK